MDKIELIIPQDPSSKPVEKEQSSRITISPKLKELLSGDEPTLRNNLIGSVMVWSMCLFNLYLLVFFVKYFPGNVFANSLTFAFTDMIALLLSG